MIKQEKKILVTGGAGYIGSHAVLELYEHGYNPIVVDNFSKSDYTLLKGIEKITKTPVVLYKGDCACKEFMMQVFQKEKNIIGVMHFAAYKSVKESVLQPLKYYKNNIDSLLSLLEIMNHYKVFNLIFSSSCTVYGEPDNGPVSESAPFKSPVSPYGATKQICEQILSDVARVNLNMQITSLRYFNPIGAHPTALLGELPIDAPNNLVPRITQTAAGLYKKLMLFGGDYNTPDGTCIRDFIHVVDLARAHVKALENNIKKSSGINQVYNIGIGTGISVLKLVKKFIETTGINLCYEVGDRRSGDVGAIYADVKKATTELGWSAKYSIEEALWHAWCWEKQIRKIK